MWVTIEIILISVYGQALLTNPTQSRLNTVQIIEDQGYICENHVITTEDGYILTFQRIPHGRLDQSSAKKTAVLLMHGLLSSSEEFVFGSPNNNIAFILADQGYDVWLGNARGNTWSRNHTFLDVVANAKEFFNFSWHEIGYYDLAAAIDYILGVTKNIKLHYIGHSQGATAFLVLTSTRPTYNTKIKLASFLCPAAVLTSNSERSLTKILVTFLDDIEALSDFFQIYEIPFIPEIRETLFYFCSQPGSYIWCSTILYMLGQNEPIEKDQLPIAFANFPSTCSIKQLFHFAQGIKNNRFSKYDYGPDKNIQRYGRKTPPSYNLSKISAPVAIYYSKHDRVVNYKDIQTLIRRLPNVVHTYMVTSNVGHLECRNSKKIVNPVDGELIKTMQKYI